MIEASERSAGRRRLPVWPLALLLAAAAVSFFLHAEASRRREQIRKAEESHALLVLARPVAATRALRSRYYQARFFLGYPASVSYAAADLMRRLVRVCEPGRVLNLQLDPGMHECPFHLTVGVDAGPGDAALRRFIVLYRDLQDIPGLADLSFTEEAASGGGRTRVFAVDGRLELP
jgi:hypothetical protein